MTTQPGSTQPGSTQPGSTQPGSTEPGRIQPSDIEAKARQIQTALDETRESVQNTAVLAGVAVAALLVVAFLYGRRKGKRSRAVVEVYRV